MKFEAVTAVGIPIRLVIGQLEKKSYEEDSKPLKSRILDCALGKNSFGTSKRVLEIAKRYDWSDIREFPDTSYKGLKKEICKFWSNYADLTGANVKVANGSSVVLSRLIEFRKYNATNSSHHTCLKRPILEWCLLR